MVHTSTASRRVQREEAIERADGKGYTPRPVSRLAEIYRHSS